MVDTGNVLYLVEQAVRHLAVGEQDVKWRVRTAYIYHLQHVFPEHVPENLAPLLVSIRKRLAKEPNYKGQSTVESAVYRMRQSTAAKIAIDMFELYLALSRRSP
jgi:hypothetical protein